MFVTHLITHHWTNIIEWLVAWHSGRMIVYPAQSSVILHFLRSLDWENLAISLIINNNIGVCE